MTNKAILIVEDDRDIRESLQQILELEGYEVLTAANGREGLDVLRGGKQPSMILLDLMMPVMNGWEFLEEQRKDQAISAIPVLVASAFGDRAKSLGTAAFIKKPIELDTLLSTVNSICQPSAAE